jgi:hypothetical protein
MEDKQLSFNDLLFPAQTPAAASKTPAAASKTPAAASQTPAAASSTSTTSKETKEAIDKDFLIGAALIMRQWKIPKNTTKLALGILNYGNKS